MMPWLDRLDALRPQITKAACGVALGATLVIVAAELVGNSEGLEHAAAHVSAMAVAVWCGCRLLRR